MKHKIFIAGIVAAGTTLSAMAVLAQNGQGLTFAKLDSNGDGQVTADEIEQRMDAHFSNVDSDSNGVLSKAELEANARKDSVARVRRMLAKLDANGDDQISPDEVRGRLGAHFAQADTDGDGLLSKAELEANASKDSVARVRRMLAKLDTDGNGVLSRDELQGGTPQDTIRRFDEDGNGAISAEEFAARRRRGGAFGFTN